MKEILPGIFHWTVVHPKIKIPVSSYYLRDERVLIDPLVPEEGLDWFRDAPEHVYLTNRHHYRASGEYEERFGCSVRCVETGMHEFSSGENVAPFRFGDTLPGDIEVLEVGVLCPDETALFLRREGGVVAVADGIVRREDGPLGFVPDEYLGDQPESVKQSLREAYRALLSLEFDHLLLAHGWPWIGGAKSALRGFIESGDTVA
jgi:glyoxylase-like metal-dependent hydrolase (beta-lactamase superfamily II)